MLSRLLNVFKKTKPPPMLLGRWGNSGKEIKSAYANHDHCGDMICKNPVEVSNLVKKEMITKSKTKYSSN